MSDESHAQDRTIELIRAAYGEHGEAGGLTHAGDDNLEDEFDQELIDTLLGLSLRHDNPSGPTGQIRGEDGRRDETGPLPPPSSAEPPFSMLATGLPGAYPQTPQVAVEPVSLEAQTQVRLLPSPRVTTPTPASLHTPVQESEAELLAGSLSPLLLGDAGDAISAPPKKHKVLVLLHEGCSNHQYVRTPRAKDIAMIVERQERIRASIIGVSAAKAKLGVEDSVSFDIHTSKRIESVFGPPVIEAHGAEWPAELTKLCNATSSRLARKEVEIPPLYNADDLYLAPQSMLALEACLGACYDAVDNLMANNYDRVHVSIRPPGHHASESVPSGFCLLNNVHCAISYACQQYHVTRVAILDFDLHHGDGSQQITWARNEANEAASQPLRIMYGSLHDINSFPCEGGQIDKVKDASICLDAHEQMIWNVHLQRYDSVEQFREIYEQHYRVLFSKAAKFFSSAKAGERSLLVLSAGFDACEHETRTMQRHGLCVPVDFYYRFTRDAVSLAKQHANGKILSVLEGGYSDRAIISGTLAHLVGLVIDEEHNKSDEDFNDWWNLPNLVALEKGFKRMKTTNYDRDNGTWLANAIELGKPFLGPSISIALNGSAPSALTTPQMTLRERKGGTPSTSTINRRYASRTPMKSKLGSTPITTTDESPIYHNSVNKLAQKLADLET